MNKVVLKTSPNEEWLNVFIDKVQLTGVSILLILNYGLFYVDAAKVDT